MPRPNNPPARPGDRARAFVHEWLQRNGVTSARDLTEVSGSFDLERPVYEVPLHPGEVLYQYIRLPEFGNPAPAMGRYFALAGATTDGVAIFDGAAGRQLLAFEVVILLPALEGTAASKPIDWTHYVGGTGGATQLFIPRHLHDRLRPRGAVERRPHAHSAV
jgi:hypothetical protein